jgi:hypothetical protein
MVVEGGREGQGVVPTIGASGWHRGSAAASLGDAVNAVCRVGLARHAVKSLQVCSYHARGSYQKHKPRHASNVTVTNALQRQRTHTCVPTTVFNQQTR